jgi:hypothetical protein
MNKEPKTPETVDKTKLNIYQKMQEIRNVIAESDVKRSSKNDDKGFKYLELADYMPLINKLGAEYGVMPHFNMGADEAVLKIIDTNKPKEVLEWTLPVEGYEMEGAQAVQLLKGKTTYMRRALYELAFEISVKDVIDAQGSTPQRPEDGLPQKDLDAIRGAKDLDQLAKISQDIKNRKGFNKEKALLTEYTIKKNELQQ